MVILISLLIIPLVACSQPQPAPDIPRYTVDQVIKAVMFSDPPRISSASTRSPSYSAHYQSHGIWQVDRLYPYPQKTYHFNERTGKVTN